MDESGAFAAVPPSRPRFCAVTAVVMRSEWVPCLLEQFCALRMTWARGAAEVKGSTLSERQMAQALRLFRAYDLTAFAAVLDTGMHPPETLRAYREGQADLLVASLVQIRRPHPKLVQRLQADAARYRALPDPLTMKLPCFTSVVEDVIRYAPRYFAGRAARELGEFHWTLDAQGADGPTDAESMWRDHVCPFLQDIFLKEPVLHLEAPGLDYSLFDRAFSTGQAELPEYLRPHLKKGMAQRRGAVFDLKRVMLTHLRFEQSHSEAGLQIADIVGSALTRALNGTIQWEGWRGLGRIFIRQSGGAVRLIRIGGEFGPALLVSGIADRVIRRITVRAKPMLPPHVEV